LIEAIILIVRRKKIGKQLTKIFVVSMIEDSKIWQEKLKKFLLPLQLSSQ